MANTFHSRRGYLHAPANASAESVATATFSVAKQDTYDVLARYETGYRFQSPFRLDIAKGAGAAPLCDSARSLCRLRRTCARTQGLGTGW